MAAQVAEFSPPPRLAGGTPLSDSAEAQWAEAMVAEAECASMVRPESDPIWDRLAADLRGEAPTGHGAPSELDAVGKLLGQKLGAAVRAGQRPLLQQQSSSASTEVPEAPTPSPPGQDDDDAWYDQLIAQNTAMSVCDPVAPCVDGPPLPADVAPTAVDDCDSDDDGWYDQLIQHNTANSLVDSGLCR